MAMYANLQVDYIQNSLALGLRGSRRTAIELLCSSVVAKSVEYAVSGIVRQPNIDNFTAVCNRESIRKYRR